MDQPLEINALKLAQFPADFDRVAGMVLVEEQDWHHERQQTERQQDSRRQGRGARLVDWWSRIRSESLTGASGTRHWWPILSHPMQP